MCQLESKVARLGRARKEGSWELIIFPCFDGYLHGAVFESNAPHAPHIPQQQPHFGQVHTKRCTCRNDQVLMTATKFYIQVHAPGILSRPDPTLPDPMGVWVCQ